MAGFEIIVRPVVFPSIRPQPARVLPAQDDPEQGIATIKGSGGKVIDLNFNFSVSLSRSIVDKEEKRMSDEARVFQEEDDGTINRDNYMDVKVLRNHLIVDNNGDKRETVFGPPEERRNVEIRKTRVFDHYG